MDALSRTLDFIQDLDLKNDEDDAVLAFRQFIESFGFWYFCVGSIKSDPEKYGRGTVWTSAHNGWVDHWISNYTRTDPVLCHLRRSNAPARWSEVKRGVSDPSLLDMFHDAAEFRIREGWSAGLKVGAHDLTGIALGTENYELGPADEVALNLGVVYCALKLTWLSSHERAGGSTLSTRERECLTWVATGKTDWDISEILQISDQTVHKHISTALKKLKASTRAQAVAMALATRQITL